MAFVGRALGSDLRFFVRPPAGLDNGAVAGSAASAWASVQAEFEAVDLALSRFRADSELTALNSPGRHRPDGRGLMASANGRGGDASGGADERRALRPQRPRGPRSDRGARRHRMRGDAGLDTGSGTASRGARAPSAHSGTGAAPGHGRHWQGPRPALGRPAGPRAAADGSRASARCGRRCARGGRRASRRRGRWVSRIRSPGVLDDDPIAVVAMPVGAIATSSVRIRNWLGPDGRPVHHLIDPATRSPATTGLLAVTVACPDPAWAEVWTKALFLAGHQAIRDEARARGMAAWWIDADGGLGMTPAARVRSTWVAEARVG